MKKFVIESWLYGAWAKPGLQIEAMKQKKKKVNFVFIILGKICYKFQIPRKWIFGLKMAFSAEQKIKIYKFEFSIK